jgi:hypothetical protein
MHVDDDMNSADDPAIHMISMEERIARSSALSTTLSANQIDQLVLLKIDNDMNSFGSRTF